MTDDRLFHKRLGHSEKVNSLSADEELVWRTYIQEADDFGVMLFSAIQIQRGHERFSHRAVRVVQRMLERVRDVGLVQTFEHQRRTYCYQWDWQTWQKIPYPLVSSLPRIPAVLLAQCDLNTQWLHTVWPGSIGRERRLSKWRPPEGWRPPGWTDAPASPVPEHSETFQNVPECSGSTRARGRAMEGEEKGELQGEGESRAHARNNGAAVVVADPDLSERAGRFVERYGELYARFRNGAHYVGRPALDFQEALLLVNGWDDERLDQLVEAFLTTDDPFCRNGSGTIAQFRSRASWCDAKLREAGL